jgi:hypothetical protein
VGVGVVFAVAGERRMGTFFVFFHGFQCNSSLVNAIQSCHSWATISDAVAEARCACSENANQMKG